MTENKILELRINTDDCQESSFSVGKAGARLQMLIRELLVRK